MTSLTKRQSTLTPLGRFFLSLPNPAAILRAQQQLNDFHQLDADARRDMGLIQDDFDTATRADFYGTPRP